MAKRVNEKYSSTDSGMGLIDSDLDSSASDAFSPDTDSRTHSSKANLDNVVSAAPNVIITTSGTSVTPPSVNVTVACPDTNNTINGRPMDTLPKMPPFPITDLRYAEVDSSESMFLADPNFDQTGPRPRSVSDVRHKRSNVRVFMLKYHGCLSLDKRITQVMIPWIIAEKCRKNTEETPIMLQVSEKGLLGISEEKGSVIFEHRLHNVFKFTESHSALFAYQWKLDEETPGSKLFVFEAKKNEDVGRICDTIKNATKNALQIDSGSHHTTRQVGLAALEELKDNNCTMFEVLYCGRVAVSHKSAPPTLIDDAIEKFKVHELEVQKKTLEASRKRHFSCEDQLDRISSDPKGYQTTSSHSLDELDTTGSLGSKSGSVSSVQTSDSEKDCELMPLDRERAGSGASINSSTSVSSNGPQRTKLKRQDTFVKLVTSRETSHNRTMVFQIGKSALTLINTDKKSFALTKKFTEISFCSQGIKNPEYFGFICREADTNAATFKCYVFKVQDEATVDTVMTTLRQAFAAALQQNRCNVVCETCPMHAYHKLCLEVKDLSPEKSLNAMRKAVETLEDKQKSTLAVFLRTEQPDNQQGQNELIMTFLRSMFEQKQAIHSHDSKSVPLNSLNESCQKVQPAPKIETRAPEGAFRKAKKSLASSFENLLSRKNKNSPEIRRRKPPVSFKQSDHSIVLTKTDAQTSPMEDQLCNLDHGMASPQVSTSPLSVHGTPERSMCISPLATSVITPPTTLALTKSLTSDGEIPPIQNRTSSHGDEAGELEVTPTKTPQRRRSKTLGDCPSPLSPLSPPPMANAIPLSPVRFTTPQMRQPLRKRMSLPPPLTRTMSVDLGWNSPNSQTLETSDKRRMSFRQAIFKRVVTPMSEKKSIVDITEETDVFEDEYDSAHLEKNYTRTDASTGRFPSKAVVRALWRRAIKEQILLIRMEKENNKLHDCQQVVSESTKKMGYEELTPCLKRVAQRWDVIVMEPYEHHTLVEIIDLLKQGIPRCNTENIWRFLRGHMERRRATILQPCPEYGSYTELIKQLTTHQHAILIDLGRTYPNHPYFVNPLGRGQLSLFNILKGYSLLDQDVGYCQGLSFVAGFLLMHMEEQQAFDMLVFTMYGLGCRRQYKPDMVALQIQMYQLSRLLHDFHRDLHDHLEVNEVSPSFYAAPWFLTLFTSQFPLGFVARVFDMLFAQGMEAIFKVALSILGNHSKNLLNCANFEELIEYIKDQLPNMTYVELEKIITQSYNLDISKELEAFEVEYHVIQEEVLHSPGLLRTGSTEQEQLESANQNLRRHNEELLEQLQTVRNKINSQEKTIHDLHEKEVQQKKEIELLYSERSTFAVTLTKLLDVIPQEALQNSGIELPNLNILTKMKLTRSSNIPSLVLFPSKDNGLCRNGNGHS